MARFVFIVLSYVLMQLIKLLIVYCRAIVYFYPMVLLQLYLIHVVIFYYSAALLMIRFRIYFFVAIACFYRNCQRNSVASKVVVRWKQDKNDKEARKKRKENPVGCTREGKR